MNYQLAALVPKIGIIRDALLNYNTYKEHNHPNKNRPTVLSTLLARRILRVAGGMPWLLCTAPEDPTAGIELLCDSGAWFRSTDLWVMGPTR